MFQCFARSLRLIVEIIMACSLHDMQVFFCGSRFVEQLISVSIRTEGTYFVANDDHQRLGQQILGQMESIESQGDETSFGQLLSLNVS